MAVIRETQKFRIGPIGVARASEGGQIVGQAISSAANDIAGMVYKAGAKKAQEAGLEAGTSAERAAIITINPETGEPEAFSPPPGFGGIATDAYQRVIRSRFQQSIEEEIKLKSKELAVRFEQNPNAVGLYETAMADYIAAMSNNATGEFSGYIKDVGTSYLNATRSNLAITQIRRERAAAKKASIEAASQANDALEAFVAMNGAASFGGDEMTEAEYISESANAGISDGASAGLLSSNEVAAMNMDQRFAIARGAIRHVSQTVTDPDELRKIQHAIGTQDLGAIPEQYSFLVDSLSLIAQTPANFAKIEKFSDGVLSDRVQLAEVYEQEAAAAAKQAEQLSVFDINELSNYTASISTITASDLNVPAIGVVGNASEKYTQLTLQARNALQAGNEDQSNAILKSRDEILSATVEGLAFRGLSGLTPEQVNQVQNAVFSNNPQLAPESARESIEAVFKLADITSPDALDKFSEEVASYRKGAARGAELEQQISAASYAKENVVPKINAISTTNLSELDQAIASAISDVDGVNGLDERIASRYRDEIYYRASLSAASSFYQTNPTEAQMDAAMGFIQTGDVGSLTENQQQILTKARGYTDESGKLSELRTYMNQRTSARVEELNQLAADKIKSNTLTNISAGLGNPLSARDRKLVSEKLTNEFANVLGDQTLGQVLLSGSVDSIPILNEIKRINILPDELHQAFSSLASGSLMVNSSPVLLSHWRNMRTQVTMTGNEMLSPAVSSLSEESIATLDALSQYGRIYGDNPEAISEALAPLRRYNSEKTYREFIDGFYDDGVDSFLQSVDGFETLPPSVYGGFRAAAIRYASLSASMDYDEKGIRDLLERQIDLSYPDGDGIVYGSDMSRRTPASLSRVIPNNERDFINFAQAQVQQDGLDASGKPLVLSVFAMNPVEEEQFRTGMITAGEGKKIFEMTTLFLQPIGSASREGTQYRVMQFKPDSPLGREPILRKKDGMMIPFVISTNDPLFTSVVNTKRAAENVSNIEGAEKRLRVLEMMGYSSGASR